MARRIAATPCWLREALRDRQRRIGAFVFRAIGGKDE
jgi:hypothetical protein